MAGTRADLDGLCGVTNERCKIEKNADDTPVLDANGKTQLALNDKGQVQFIGSLEDFLETPAGQKMAGITGGIQGAKGTFMGIPYEPGGLIDKLHEAFGGPHDHIGGKVSGLYDEQGNIKRGMSGVERTAYDVWAAVAIPPSAPFAMAELLPPEVWKAISILLGAAK